MISKTTLSAIRALVFLARNERGGVFSPRRIAGELGESPTYMAKVATSLAKAGLVHAEKGAKGGVVLLRPPEQINLLSVLEACQGPIVGDYCSLACGTNECCAYHEAAVELEKAMVKVLGRWNIGHLARRPVGALTFRGLSPCVMGARRVR